MDVARLQRTPSNEEALAQLQRDFDSWLDSSLAIAESICQKAPSREMSLVKTKLEEAQMWRERVTQ